MTNLIDLETAIDSILQSGRLPSNVVLRCNSVNYTYEAYIFSLVLKAVEDFGAQVELRSINNQDSTPTDFIFRGSRGYIYSDSSDYGYAFFTYNNKDYEIHVEVQHHGSCGVLHKIDISIIESNEACKCRRRKLHPSSGKTKGIIGCKFGNNVSDIDKIRSYVGLTTDFGSIDIRRFVTNYTSPTISAYCSGKGDKRPRFSENVTPLNISAEHEFICNIKDDLKKWLG